MFSIEMPKLDHPTMGPRISPTHAEKFPRSTTIVHDSTFGQQSKSMGHLRKVSNVKERRTNGK
jgi:hypothetical protein